MDSTVRSAVVAVSIAFVVVVAGCAGTPAPADTTETPATNGGTPDTDGGSTTTTTSTENNEGTATTDSAEPTTDGNSSNTPTSLPDNKLAVKRDATWVTTSSADGQNTPREYITLQYESVFADDPGPVNLSGYTVTYGSGPTYTIPDNVAVGPGSSAEFYVWTGNGEDRAYGDWVRSIRSRYILHAGQDGPLISQGGTTVTVRNRNGTIVSENTVTPMNGTVPFVPTVNATRFIGSVDGSIDTIRAAKSATPFELRAPTNLTEGYEFRGLTMGYEIGLYSYGLSYSRIPNSSSDDFFFVATAPRNAERMSGGEGPQVNVGNQTGYYTTQGTGNDTRGTLRFVGPDEWAYVLIGPQSKERLIQIGESIEVVEDNATE